MFRSQSQSILLKYLNDYKKERQANPENKYAIPELDEYAEYQPFVNQFDGYMQYVAKRETHTDTEYLLKWIDIYHPESVHKSVQNYQGFLKLAQAVAARGYKTAIDVPISEEEFTYRKEIREFDSWMKKNENPEKTHLENLLICLNKDKIFSSYEKFLTLAKILANKGYLTLIDVPISEKEFNDFVFKKYCDLAYDLAVLHAKNPERIAFIEKFYYTANQCRISEPNFSSQKQNKILAEMLENESTAISNKYRPVFANLEQSFFYRQVKKQLEEKYRNNNIENNEEDNASSKFCMSL